MEFISERRNLAKIKRKTICKFPSKKGDVSVVYTEGVLEEYFCYHLEFDSSVIEYQCQPLGYYYFFNDKKLSYTPDFKVIVESEGGRSEIYYEIKERKHLDESFEVEFKAKQWPPNNIGSELILIDDDFIMQRPKLSNFKRVYAAKRRGLPSDEIINAVNKVFLKLECMIAENLMDMIDISIGEVYQLIYYKVLIADFNESFGPEMTVWRN